MNMNRAEEEKLDLGWYLMVEDMSLDPLHGRTDGFSLNQKLASHELETKGNAEIQIASQCILPTVRHLLRHTQFVTRSSVLLLPGPDTRPVTRVPVIALIDFI